MAVLLLTRRMKFFTAAALLAGVLAGCTAPLVPAPYSGKVSVKTTRTIAVTVEPGEMLGRHENLWFDVEDQYTVARHLERELERLGIARLAHAGRPDWVWRLAFVRTRHIYDFNEYVLDVELWFGSDRDAVKRRYHVRSAEGDNIMTKMFTDASEGKRKAADKLLAKMIPDIEAWILEQPVSVANSQS